MKSADDSEMYRMPSLGIDNIYNTWVRQQMAYRQQLLSDLLSIALNTEEVRATITHIGNEVFRRGIKWKPKFSQKCEDCDVEYMEITKECKSCHRHELKEPDPHQKDVLNHFLDDCNIWDQSLEEVLRGCWFDVNALDDMFLYIVKEYIEGDDSESEVLSKVIEIRRLHPGLVEFDLDEQGLPKNSHWTCLIHRDEEIAAEPGDCSVCGREMQSVMYKYYHRGRMVYLLDSEIVHLSKFSPSETYGWSPILTVMYKALCLIGMDRNVFRYFYERRMPASMLMVFTDDPESMRRERENIATKMRQDPNYIPMVAVSTKQSRGRVDMVRLFHTLQEMDYLPVRNEIRERISAMWGVTHVWQGAPEAYGGLSAQTQQLTVMSRVVESDQRLIHEKVFPLILESFGITDWTLELPQPEEKAEATRISFAQQRISAANMLSQMGFDIEIVNEGISLDDVDFVVSGKAMNQQQMMGMGMPGMGGPGEEGMPMEGAEEGMPMDEEAALGGLAGTTEPTQAYGGGDSQSPLLDTGPLTLSMKSNGRSNGHSNGASKGQMAVQQIMDKGFPAPMIKEVAPDMSYIIFESLTGEQKANFSSGELINVEKYVSPKMHTHDGHPMHDINLPHDVNRKQRNEDRTWEPEEPDIESP